MKKIAYTIIAGLDECAEYLIKFFWGYVSVSGILFILLIFVADAQKLTITDYSVSASELANTLKVLEWSIRVFSAVETIVFQFMKDTKILKLLLSALIFSCLPFDYRCFIGTVLICMTIWGIWNLVFRSLRQKYCSVPVTYEALINKYGHNVADELIKVGALMKIKDVSEKIIEKGEE